jgi:hypothetical protein
MHKESSSPVASRSIYNKKKARLVFPDSQAARVEKITDNTKL